LPRWWRRTIIGGVSVEFARAPARRAVSVAGLFPGQGSHVAGMRAFVERVSPELASRCIELVGEDPFAHAAESTRFAQPAIFCASVASWTIDGRRRAEVAGGRVDVAYAGHSLGELAALVAAGALEPDDGLRLAVLRGELMAVAAERDGDGGMLALVGATREQCEALLSGHDEVVIANDNAPGQLVLAGAGSRLAELAADARREGIRSLVLDVAGAFHSPAMAAAVEPFAAALGDVRFDFPQVQVVSCSTATPFIDIRRELAEAIVKPVRWRETMAALLTIGAEAFIDFGPGQVLERLVDRNVPGGGVLEPLRGDPVESSGRAA
jgi:[acyl-carrier-protein] S-malonyltransferase